MGRSPFIIVGVVKDMIMESPFNPVRQAVYLVNYDDANSLYEYPHQSQTGSGDALAKTEAVFKKLVPAVPFDYQFADTEYGLKFAAEERIGKLASVFATLAIFISCLGLFGLASFVAEKRTKEIGVRKVLGASVYNLMENVIKRLCDPGNYFLFDCHSCCLVLLTPMVTEI